MINEIIHQYLTVNYKFREEMMRNYFKNQLDEAVWIHIENYIKMIVGLPLWKDRTLSETIFATKQTPTFWKSVFDTGKSPDGLQVISVPLTLLNVMSNSRTV